MSRSHGRKKAPSSARMGVAAAAALLLLLLAAVPAGAAVSHTFSFSFGAGGSTPANPYPLSGPTDVAVDQTTQDVYVTDPGNHRVEKFDKAGNLLLTFGKGVNATTGGDVCIISTGNTCQAGATGSAVGDLTTPTYLAVDNSGGPSAGDVYVGDTNDNIVSKFTPEGQLITGWGNNGQKDGGDATDLPVFGPLFGLAVAGNGNLYVGGHHYSGNEWEYTQDGTYIKWYASSADEWLEGSPSGNGTFYYGGSDGHIYLAVPEFTCECQDTSAYQLSTGTPLTGFTLDPTLPEIYQDTGSEVQHYNNCTPVASGPCGPEDSFGGGDLSGARGVSVDGDTHAVYAANTGSNDVAVFGDARPAVTTGPPTDVTQTSVTLTGHVDPEGKGNISKCQFEWGFETTYGHVLPCEPDPASANFTGPTDVTAVVSGLSPGTEDHYRLVVENTAEAKAAGIDRTFITTQPPAIDGLTAEDLTATTADLKAQVNPNGLETTWQFEYGTTIEYGQAAPVPGGTIAAGNGDQEVNVHLEDLVPHVVYHYRLVATNADGTAPVEDHTFNFYPPACPNTNVRQQTHANYLPDCRAYELVSPEDAGGTQLFANGPNTGYATSPSRLAFTGQFATIPGSGGDPIDGSGDLYVATRTSTGWTTRYVGMPANETPIDGGPPLGPPNSTPAPNFRAPSAEGTAAGLCPACQNYVFTDPEMDLFATFAGGNQAIESSFVSDFANPTPIASDAPYVRDAYGTFVDRWPTNLATVPPGKYPPGASIYAPGEERVKYRAEEGDEELTVSPGGLKALDCPWMADRSFFNDMSADDCAGDVTSSGDMTHFVFASEWNAFAPGGILEAPGSVYDNNTQAETVEVVSKTSAGGNIPSEPTDTYGDPLQIPAVSQDGSHILMASGAIAPCGEASCPTPPCGVDYSQVRRCQMQPSHLYMRVDDAMTYDVSQGHAVSYVGTDAAADKVYFTTPEQLLPADQDHSVDLYMWSEAGELEGSPLTLVSKADGGGGAGQPGNSDECAATFTEACNVTMYTQLFYCQLGRNPGGNCISDNAIAPDNGDIYFISPEQLEGTRGIGNQQNLYVYREGAVQFVATLKGEPYCITDQYSFARHCQGLERIQVSRDDSHMAFVTSNRVTQYDNAGHTEMYTYDPSTRRLVCVSCKPDGAPPTSEVEASQDGLFMTNDGRAFFSTEDALVHSDTNEEVDVYEYVGGRAQLITPGTGQTAKTSGGVFGVVNEPGLAGVSADGRDVYFVTYDTLVPQDHNGLFAKFYDARTDGGFPAPEPDLPCEAADECHGEGSSAPTPLNEETSARLVEGNAKAGSGHHGTRAPRHCARHVGHRHGHPHPSRRGRRYSGHRRCKPRQRAGKRLGGHRHGRLTQRTAGGAR